MSHAFHAKISVNHENLFALGNGLGRALRLASRAGNAGFVNGHGHGKSPQTLEEQDAAAGSHGTALNTDNIQKLAQKIHRAVILPPLQWGDERGVLLALHCAIAGRWTDNGNTHFPSISVGGCKVFFFLFTAREILDARARSPKSARCPE
jgi:hypothetical protein